MLPHCRNEEPQWLAQQFCRNTRQSSAWAVRGLELGVVAAAVRGLYRTLLLITAWWLHK